MVPAKACADTESARMRVPATEGRDASAPAGSTSARALASIVAGIVVLQLGWAVALPAFRGPDEIEHVKRSSGVAAGEFLAPSGTVTVEDDVVAAQVDVCLRLHSDFDPTICAPVTGGSDGAQPGASSVPMRSAAARYNPVWYVLVAPASWLLEGSATVWGIRATGALASALLLGWALSLHRPSCASQRSDTAMMLCVTPAVAFASIVAAPNGLHFAASLLFWVALLSADAGRRPTWALCVGGAVMSLTHTLGFFWILCAMVVLVSLRGGAHLRQLGRDLVKSPVALTMLVAAQAFAILWIAISRPNDPTGDGDVLAESTKEIPALAHGLVWVMQLVGTMPFRFGLLWPVVYVLWVLAFAVWWWLSLRRADAHEKRAMVTIVTMAVAIPTVVTLLTFENHGYAWQGRYELPLLFGLPLIAGAVTTSVPPRRRWSSGYILFLGLAMALAALCLALREGSNVVEATAVVALSVTGWWLMWGATWLGEHSQHESPPSVR